MREVASTKGFNAKNNRDVISALWRMSPAHFQFYRHMAKVQTGKDSMWPAKNLHKDLSEPMEGAEALLKYHHPHKLASHLIDVHSSGGGFMSAAGKAGKFMQKAGKTLWKAGVKTAKFAVKHHKVIETAAMVATIAAPIFQSDALAKIGQVGSVIGSLAGAKSDPASATGAAIAPLEKMSL
jgi:hypothetical protein